MPRVRKVLPGPVDVAHLISTGLLAKTCPRDLIDQVLNETGRASQRQRLLPAPAVVYFVMALALWREAPLEEVLRVVCEGLHWLGRDGGGEIHASKSALSQARTRLGADTLHRLADRVLQPIAPAKLPGSHYRQWRVMAIDGTCLDVPDERGNADYFGYPGTGRGACAFPQVRLLGLVECGTHVVAGAAMGPFREGERALAARLLPSKLQADMLLLADRGFYSFKLWQLACATKAKLVWRVSARLNLPAQQVLADGSYLSTVFSSDDTKRQHGQTVRVIDYAPIGANPQTARRYRLVTNLLEPGQADALELATLYHERWEIESVFDELKTHLRGARTVLRSKRPELVRQEIWGLLLAHFAIRQLMMQAAWPRELDPDQLSFVHALRVIKRKLPQAAAIPP